MSKTQILFQDVLSLGTQLQKKLLRRKWKITAGKKECLSQNSTMLLLCFSLSRLKNISSIQMD